jgi:hypothetical protein
MAAVLKELAGLAGSDGQIKLGGEDAASRAKTAAVLKGIGAGLGAALAEAFGKWAEKLAQPPSAAAPGTTATTPAGTTPAGTTPATGAPATTTAPEKPADATPPAGDGKTDPPKSN